MQTYEEDVDHSIAMAREAIELYIEEYNQEVKTFLMIRTCWNIPLISKWLESLS